jgi:hypothetical protein
MLGRRQVALAELEQGDGDLLIEWSAPRDARIDDVDAWRLASPHWTPRRERLIRKQLTAAQAGELLDPEEPDPVEAFRAQYLNQWPQATVASGEQLLPPGLWQFLVEPDVRGTSDLYVAVEDDFGNGAAVAAACRLDDGRIEVDGWLCRDWDTAILDVQRLGLLRRIRHLQVGASMLARVPAGTVPAPVPAGGVETRLGLPLIRDLAAGGGLVHDETTGQLDQAVAQAQVKELSTGLSLVPTDKTHLVKALAWAVNAAHKPVPVPSVF